MGDGLRRQSRLCKTDSACSASFTSNGVTSNGGYNASGFYRVAAQNIDQNNGVSPYELVVNDHRIDSWIADDHLPSDQMNGHTSTRHTTVGVELKKGDVVKIVGHPDGGSPRL